MCDRFHCTPDVAMAMDSDVLRMLKIEALAGPEDGEGASGS